LVGARKFVFAIWKIYLKKTKKQYINNKG
jgi:hypothetical protein